MRQPTTWRTAVRGTAAAALTAALLTAVVPGSFADTGNDASSRIPGQTEPQSQRTVDVQILGLNETHGQLTPLKRDGRPAGGAATLAAYLKQEEAENSRTLILDSGDFMQGPAISSYFQGASTVDVFNRMGVDSVAVGNHEFDWGQDTFAERVKQAEFPFLAANIIDDATGTAPQGVQPHIIEELDGVKVGVIGVANPDTKNVTLPAATEDLTFLDFARTAEAVNAAVEELRAQKVETIVVSAHQGLETETSGALAELVSQLSGEVDPVLGGHIPLEFTTVINGIPVGQPYGNTRGYADVTLTVDRATKDVVGTAVELDPTWVDGIAPDPAVKAIVDGPITLEEIFAVLPFNNTLVTMYLTGAQVRQVLEEGAFSQYGTVQVSGLKWAYDADAPFGARVTSVTLPDGTPLDPVAGYRVATNNFMATGGDQFTTFTQGTNTVDTGINLVDSVVHYLEHHSPVDPQVEGRLTVG